MRGARAASRSKSQPGIARNSHETAAICQGTTARRRFAAMTRAMRRAASSALSRNGMRKRLARVIGVSMYPGQTQTTATPLPCSSARRLSIQLTTAALEAQ